jgi:hypothetical protein
MKASMRRILAALVVVIAAIVLALAYQLSSSEKSKFTSETGAGAPPKAAGTTAARRRDVPQLPPTGVEKDWSAVWKDMRLPPRTPPEWDHVPSFAPLDKRRGELDDNLSSRRIWAGQWQMFVEQASPSASQIDALHKILADAQYVYAYDDIMSMYHLPTREARMRKVRSLPLEERAIAHRLLIEEEIDAIEAEFTPRVQAVLSPEQYKAFHLLMPRITGFVRSWPYEIPMPFRANLGHGEVAVVQH